MGGPIPSGPMARQRRPGANASNPWVAGRWGALARIVPCGAIGYCYAAHVASIEWLLGPQWVDRRPQVDGASTARVRPNRPRKWRRSLQVKRRVPRHAVRNVARGGRPDFIGDTGRRAEGLRRLAAANRIAWAEGVGGLHLRRRTVTRHGRRCDGARELAVRSARQCRTVTKINHPMICWCWWHGD